ncbi:diaminopimelate decarboxylase [Parvularcula sp. LCG005]|uniref:diaminopimelate decarboxylase n=1 Tax=Parvularcula sp. LCG005 TaxID=3078805 RepID=UPI002942147B|nr:diaminopimelate decarboxylase [Parvularcula sp. LCG005]WOI53095.1 diaminopimelate decarboxylase [Parvularcula sp. LCG005]
MDHFAYVDGTLCAENVPLPEIARSVGTPFYVYSTATLRRHFDVFAEGFAGTDTLIAFAVKSLSNIAVLSLLGKRGAGADIVSGGELFRALKAGIPAERIVFSGVGKTEREIADALDAGIGQFNVEGEAELAVLSRVASEKGMTAPVSFRINPDVDAGTHDKISTGRKGDKFGVPRARTFDAYALAEKLPGIRVQGVAMHIGSQITSLAPFEAAARSAVELVGTLRGMGHDIRTLDLGGGLGIPYGRAAEPPPLPSDYAKLIRSVTDGTDIRVMLEPGRMIVGNAGLFVVSMLYAKDQETRTYAIVDGAMNDLIRPMLYGAHHEIMPVTEKDAAATNYDVAGPVCESTDLFARDVALQDPQPGDLLAFRTAGAYGAVSASQYNTRPLVPEVLVDGDRFHVIRRRPSYEDILSLETIPDLSDH